MALVPSPTVTGLTAEDANTSQSSGSLLNVNPGDTLNVIFNTNGNTVYQHLGNASWGSVTDNGGVVAMLTSSGGQNYNLTNAGGLSVPVYGYNGLSNWYNGYSASSLGSSDSGAVNGTIPSNASGQYTLNVYYVDGIGRVGDESMQINVQAAPAVQAPTLTLTTPSTSVATGTNVPLTATASSLASNEGITIHDMSNDNTIGGTNASTGGTGVNPYTANATSQTAEIVTYEAGMDWVNPSTGQTQVIDSNQINVAYTAPAAGTLSLTANPTSLNVGSPSAVSANYNGTMPSNSAVYIHDISGDNTLNGTNVYEGNIGSSSASTNATDSKAQTVEYEAALLVNGSYIHSAPVYVTWNAPSTSGLTLSASPTSQTVGKASTLTASYSGSASIGSNSIIIHDMGGKYTLNNGGTTTYTGNSGATTATTTALANSAYTESYDATAVNANGQTVTSNTVSVTWSAATAPTPTGPSQSTTFSLAGNPPTLPVGSTETLTVTVPPDPSLGYYKSGEFIVIYDTTTGQMIWPGGVTGQYPFTNSPTANGIADVATTTYTSNTAGTQNFEAQLWDTITEAQSGASPSLTAAASADWIQPSITLSVNPANNFTGMASTISYSTIGFASGDYVVISGTGGYDMWSELNDTNSTDTYSETESPTNGQTTTVNYTATMMSSTTGQTVATSTATDSWSAPTITMTASPANNIPGQTSNLSYAMNVALPSGYSVSVTPSGNGADMWNASDLTTQDGSYQETENPAGGQTIAINYTAAVINDSNGQTLATGSTSVNWVNPWAGSVNLSANPALLEVGNLSTVTATASQALPSGYSVSLYDTTTGQLVAEGSTQTTISNQTQYTPQTDTFTAYVSDAYGNVGAPSNSVSVDWAGLNLSANPTMLAMGQTSVITVTDQNVPTGYWLIAYNEQTGQTDSVQGSSLTWSLSESTAQTDNLIAYVASSNSVSSQLFASNVVPVNWYGVNLVANPTMLPTGSMTMLTATAQNMPTGYEIDIVDQSTGQIVAQGQPGQTTLSTTQTRSQVETDQYVANVVQPSNPVIPGLSVPGPTVITTGGDAMFPYGTWNQLSVGGTIINISSTGTAKMVGSTPVITGDIVLSGGYNLTVPGSVFDYGYTTYALINGVDYYVVIEVDYDGGSSFFTFVSFQGPSTITNVFFPFFTFASAPSYVPTSLFPSQAQTSGSYPGAIWTTNAVDPPNGTAFFQSTFSLPSAQSVTFNLPTIDNYAQVYVDGRPIMQQGGSGGVGGSIPNTSSVSVTLPAGMHQVIVEAMNNNGFGGTNPNPAGVALNVTAGGSTLLTTATPSEWTTTGYVTSLPSGWFSGAIGNWAWTEYVMQESTSQPIYESQAYSLSTLAASVAATSTPVSVTWYNYPLALTTSATSLHAGASDTLTATLGSGTQADLQNGDYLAIEAVNPTTGVLNTSDATISNSDTTPALFVNPAIADAQSNVNYTGTYEAILYNSSNQVLQVSNTVQVTWTPFHGFISYGVTHEPGWFTKLNTWIANPPTGSTPRTVSDFWAGEWFVPYASLAETTGDPVTSVVATLEGINYDSMAPVNVNTGDWPTSLTVNLTYNSTSKEWTGQITDAAYQFTEGSVTDAPFMFLQEGTYPVIITATYQDGTVISKETDITILGRWEGITPNDYYHLTETLN